MGQLEVNGAKLEVLECGRGPELVLVHGSASDHRTWSGQRERWCDAFRVVSYSRRYHWPNETIDEGGTYALDDHVADLGELLVRLEAAPATLVGHSYGGVVSLVLATRRPELVRSLVLIEPPVLGLVVSVPPGLLELLGLALRRPLTALGVAKLGAGGLGPATAAAERGDRDAAIRHMGEAILGSEAFGELASDRVEQVRDNYIPEELTSEEALPRLEASEIASVGCPAMLVEGARSPGVFSRLLDHLDELLPDSRRVTIPGSSHIVHEDNPARFHAEVEAFLS